jgi:mono/diheme cytochrome c family protein
MPDPSPHSPRSSADRRLTITSAVAVTLAVIGAASCGSESTEPGAMSGSDLYATNCASCHGADLRGTDQGPSHLSIVYEPGHHDDDSFRSAIERGTQQHHWPFGDMAQVEGLDDDEVNAIITFVRAEQELEGFEPYPP